MQQESRGNAKRRMGVDEQIERCVQFALQGASPNRSHDERRRHKRHPFPYPVRLLPVNARNEIVGEPIVVLGKHLTNQGFDFYYQHPVSYRRVIVSFDCELSERVEMLMDLTWCRFNGHGWYENGGRFLSAIDRPVPDQPVPDQSLTVIAGVESVVPYVNAAEA
ncbi:MAG: hypothetical protein O3C40_12310 [Planctomycetota bacterium]|nr:hypothetical protein [Planctomycetota bacterium]